MTADVILERLLALHPRKIDLSLDRMHHLLAALGHPERSLPPVVHVAGTNGKGSVIAFLRAMAEAAGLSVHVYTSPHLVRFHERVRLNGRLIGDDALQALLEECETANGGTPITFFEITTAAALLAFARHPADLLLLEVGLGGRLDATNVIDAPMASVITPVSMDHQEFLGREIAVIAAEKAGIIKPDAPAVIGPQEPEALAVMAERAKAVAAPFAAAGQDWQIARRNDGWQYRDGADALDLPLPGLSGPHQLDNAALAIAAIRRAGLAVSPEAMAEGLRAARWPARMQTLSAPEYAAEILIDGGHNPAAASALARALGEMPAVPTRMLTGMLANRNPADFLAPLQGRIGEIWAVPLAGHDCHPPEVIVAAAEQAGMTGRAFNNLESAFAALRAAPYEGRLLIGGSLYLAGEALGRLGAFPD